MDTDVTRGIYTDLKVRVVLGFVWPSLPPSLPSSLPPSFRPPVPPSSSPCRRPLLFLSQAICNVTQAEIREGLEAASLGRIAIKWANQSEQQR